jgi:hypothetical protein
MSTPIHINENDIVGRVHTVYLPNGLALFDFIVDPSKLCVTVSQRGFVLKNTKQQLNDFH